MLKPAAHNRPSLSLLLLSGPNYHAPEGDLPESVRGSHAFNNPQLLEGFVGFLRERGLGFEAVAAGLVVPKRMVAYPQVRLRLMHGGSRV